MKNHPRTPLPSLEGLTPFMPESELVLQVVLQTTENDLPCYPSGESSSEYEKCSFVTHIYDDIPVSSITAIQFAEQNRVLIYNTLTEDPALLNAKDNFEQVLKFAISANRVFFTNETSANPAKFKPTLTFRPYPTAVDVPYVQAGEGDTNWLCFNVVEIDMELAFKTGSPFMIYESKRRIRWKHVLEITDINEHHSRIVHKVKEEIRKDYGQEVDLGKISPEKFPDVCFLYAEDGQGGIDRYYILADQIKPIIEIMDKDCFDPDTDILSRLVQSQI